MEALFSSFSVRALWTPELLVGLLIVAILYTLLLTKWSKHFKEATPVPFSKKVYFVFFLIALYIGWGSPLYIAGHLMFSLHMVQMVCAYLIAVPLLILSLPKWFLVAIVSRVNTAKWSRPLVVIWNPIVALFLFNGLFSFYHVPYMFDTLMQYTNLHSIYYLALFVAAFMMWWFMIQPVPSDTKLTDLRRVLYIFLNGLMITPACALIIFAPNAMYETYTNADIWANAMAFCIPTGGVLPYDLFEGPQAFNQLDARMDQQIAGVLMKIMQEIVYGITIGYVFKQWLSKEKQQDGELSISDIPTTLKTE